MTDKNVVDEAIAEAKTIGDKEVANKLKHNTVGGMFSIQPVVPVAFDEEGRPLPKKEIKRQVDAFCEEQKKAILAHSIGLAMGIDVPTGMAFDTVSLEAWVKELGFSVRRASEGFEVVVKVDGGEYKIIDSSRYHAGLRAIHFALTRHDPDTDEYVQRRLFSEMQSDQAAAVAAAQVVH